MEDKIFTMEEFNKTDFCYELSDEKLSDDVELSLENTAKSPPNKKGRPIIEHPIQYVVKKGN